VKVLKFDILNTLHMAAQNKAPTWASNIKLEAKQKDNSNEY